MRKQFIMEWRTKKGNDGWKKLGKNISEEEIEKQLGKMIKKDHIASVRVLWLPIGEDTPDERIGEENHVKGYKKDYINLFGSICWLNDNLQEY